MNAKNKGVILACYPHPNFPTISITAGGCALNCKHCNRQYLKQMIPCPFPDLLVKTCLKFAENGVKGILLSGGYNSEGYVPYEEFIDAIETIKKETGIFISAHTGLVPDWLAKKLGRAGVNLADFDLIGDDETIKSIIGLEKKTGDYLKTMKSLKKALPEVTPHICVGLHDGKLNGEFRAVEMAAEINPKLLVFLSLIPTRNTPLEECAAPPIQEIERVISFARERIPKAELALGCMRSRDDERAGLEKAAINAGVRRVVMPSKETIEWAEKSGFAIKRFDACCAAPIGGSNEG